MQPNPIPAGAAPAQSTKTPRQILVEARALISDPQRWTTQFFAVTDKGRQIGYMTAGACKFCAVGAIGRVSGMSDKECLSESEPMQALRLAIGAHGVAEFNDSHSHAEVLAAFDKAIASLPEAA